jgi:general secretion pathway protein A
LNQRISVRFETKALSREDTEHYVRHRLAVAGASSRLRFARGTFRSVWRYSRGYPRLINLICDRALLAAFTERSLVITRRHARRAALGLKGEEMIFRFAPGWLRKIVPYALPALLLFFVLCVMLYRSFVN